MDDALTEDQVRRKVESEMIKAGSIRALAREWRISASYLCDFLNGRRGPGPQILRPLGLIQVVEVRYIRGKSEGRRRRVRLGS